MAFSPDSTGCWRDSGAKLAGSRRARLASCCTGSAPAPDRRRQHARPPPRPTGVFPRDLRVG
ncbi:hypothetical protein F1C58_03745 [Glaciihabitans sp. INWT7]|nr:hypothetical protein F1C58_03745 [Glaciihabitans sp. INWT7]